MCMSYKQCLYGRDENIPLYSLHVTRQTTYFSYPVSHEIFPPKTLMGRQRKRLYIFLQMKTEALLTPVALILYKELSASVEMLSY